MAVARSTSARRPAAIRTCSPCAAWTEVIRDAVEEGVAPPGAPTFADGLACARVLDAIRRA